MPPTVTAHGVLLVCMNEWAGRRVPLWRTHKMHHEYGIQMDTRVWTLLIGTCMWSVAEALCLRVAAVHSWIYIRDFG